MLTICIPTIEGREADYQNLVDCLTYQIAGLPIGEQDSVKVISCCDNKQMPIGFKRQLLLNNVHTEWFVMIDDDDDVADYYIVEIVEALKQGPDCVGFNGVMITNKKKREDWVISNKHKHWVNKGGVYLRHTNHIVPVRASIAKAVGFDKQMKHGEDYKYSMGLVGKVGKEVFIDKEMYYYNKK